MYIPKTATLLVTFNRPDYTTRVLERLRELRIPRLYIFNDGPRENNTKDLQARNTILELVDQIDWECDVRRFFSEVNLGCGLGVSTAITWAFSTEDRLVILEDDCIPSMSFYPYCDELLDRYHDDQRVWVVCGENHDFPQSSFRESDYIFSQFGFNWGWATWKRCWNKFDISMRDLKDFLSSEYIYSIFSDKAMTRTYLNKIQSVDFQSPKPSFWTVQFGFQILLGRGYFIIPAKNLITNIGETGDHTAFASRFLNCPSENDFSITNYPKFVLHCRSVDRFHYKRHIIPMMKGKPMWMRALNKILRSLNTSKA